MREKWRALDGQTVGLLMDAMECLYNAAPARRTEVKAFLRTVGEWHEHDVEDEHCLSTCAGWAEDRYCPSCGQHHSASVAMPS